MEPKLSLKSAFVPLGIVALIVALVGIIGYGMAKANVEDVAGKQTPVLQFIRLNSQGSASVRLQEMGDGHDYLIAMGAGGQGIAIVHAAGCRKCCDSNK